MKSDFNIDLSREQGEFSVSEYAKPEAIVSTAWVASHRSDTNVRVVEVDVDTKAYDEGHVPGAIAWSWNTQLSDQVRRDILSKAQFEELMSSSGVRPDTTLIVYGDNNNWFAAWAVWQAKIYGHRDVRLMNGGRKKWLSEGRDLSTDTPQLSAHSTQRATPIFLCALFFLRPMKHPLKSRPRWWMFAVRRSSQAKFWRRPDCRKPASEADMCQEHAIYLGAKHVKTMGRSSRPMSFGVSMPPKA
jgi:Rhodanese-like domain